MQRAMLTSLSVRCLNGEGTSVIRRAVVHLIQIMRQNIVKMRSEKL